MKKDPLRKWGPGGGKNISKVAAQRTKICLGARDTTSLKKKTLIEPHTGVFSL